MSLLSQVSNVARWPLLEVGSPSPRLSLTADEGTWIKIGDFKDQANVVLVFFGSMHDDATDAWLKRWQGARAAFEELETAIFGVNTARTDKLRELRSRLGLEFFLLYDPLAVDSRGFRASGRVRPVCKPNVVIIDKKGKIAYAARGMVDPQEALDVVARLEGKGVPVVAPEKPAVQGVRNPGQQPEVVKHIDSLKAEALLKSKDSPYILVDVRTFSEYEPDHSPLAKHLPVDELPHRYQELNQTTHIIFVCQAGGRSQAAAEFMTSIGGAEIYSVINGMAEWKGDRVVGGKA